MTDEANRLSMQKSREMKQQQKQFQRFKQLLSIDHTSQTSSILPSVPIPTTTSVLSSLTITDEAKTSNKRKATTLDSMQIKKKKKKHEEHKQPSVQESTISSVPLLQFQDQQLSNIVFRGDKTDPIFQILTPNCVSNQILFWPAHDYIGVYSITEPGWDMIPPLRLTQSKSEPDHLIVDFLDQKQYDVTPPSPPIIRQCLVPLRSYQRLTYTADQDDTKINVVDLYKFLTLLSSYPRSDRRLLYLDDAINTLSSSLDKMNLCKTHKLVAYNGQRTNLSCSDVTYMPMSMFEFLRDFESHDSCSFDIAFIYPFSFTGNTFVKPYCDIAVAFQRSLLARKNGVLWCSLVSSPQFDINFLVYFVLQTARSFNYVLELHYIRSENDFVNLMWITK